MGRRLGEILAPPAFMGIAAGDRSIVPSSLTGDRTWTVAERDGTRGSGLGLAIAKGLVELHGAPSKSAMRREAVPCSPAGFPPGGMLAVQRLRRRMGWHPPARSPIESVRGFGYRYRGAGWPTA